MNERESNRMESFETLINKQKLDDADKRELETRIREMIADPEMRKALNLRLSKPMPTNRFIVTFVNTTAGSEAMNLFSRATDKREKNDAESLLKTVLGKCNASDLPIKWKIFKCLLDVGSLGLLSDFVREIRKLDSPDKYKKLVREFLGADGGIAHLKAALERSENEDQPGREKERAWLRTLIRELAPPRVITPSRVDEPKPNLDAAVLPPLPVTSPMRDESPVSSQSVALSEETEKVGAMPAVPEQISAPPEASAQTSTPLVDPVIPANVAQVKSESKLDHQEVVAVKNEPAAPPVRTELPEKAHVKFKRPTQTALRAQSSADAPNAPKSPAQWLDTLAEGLKCLRDSVRSLDDAESRRAGLQEKLDEAKQLASRLQSQVHDAERKATELETQLSAERKRSSKLEEQLGQEASKSQSYKLDLERETRGLRQAQQEEYAEWERQRCVFVTEVETLKKELTAEHKRAEQDIALARIDAEHAVGVFKAELWRRLKPSLADVRSTTVTEESLAALPSGERILLWHLDEILKTLRALGAAND